MTQVLKTWDLQHSEQLCSSLLSSIKAHSDISASGPLCIYSDQDYYYSVEKTLEPEVQLQRICFIIQKNSIAFSMFGGGLVDFIMTNK